MLEKTRLNLLPLPLLIFSLSVVLLEVFVPKKKDTPAFLHDANARGDLKVAQIREKFGLEGYGAFFMIVEILREQSSFKIPISDISGLNIQLKPHKLEFEKFLEFCFQIKIFRKDKKYMWSNSLLNRMKSFDDARRRMSEGGKKGMQKRYKHLTSTLQGTYKHPQYKYNTNTNTNEIELKAKEILAHLNQVTGRNYQEAKLIVENLLSGKTVEQHMHIIDTKIHDNHFIENPNLMRPKTLFGDNFDSYVNEKPEDFQKKKAKEQQKQTGAVPKAQIEFNEEGF